MSASSSPTLSPNRASATARFAATVDLPTPPLPLPTAMMCLRAFEPHAPGLLAKLGLNSMHPQLDAGHAEVVRERMMDLRRPARGSPRRAR